jgi:hypothetical protein
MFRRIVRQLVFGFVLCSAWVPLLAQSDPVRATPATAGYAAASSHSRILAKFQSPYAETLEAALPGSMSFEARTATAPEAQAFMSRYRLTAMSPLYRDLVGAKIRQHVSADQLAEEVREKYPSRARRLRAAFQPPDISRTWVLELQDPAQLASTLTALRSDANIEYAEEDGTVGIAFTPNDPYYSSSGTWGQPYYDLWGIHKIDAGSAWDTSTGSGIVVAVVDTGIDDTHPDIAANVSTKLDWNYITNAPGAIDDNGHGTHVSGTIAAVGNNGIGVIGVAWNAKIMAVKGLNSDGEGADSTLALCLEYAANNGADVINNSWGGGYSQTIADAINYAYDMGMVVVAAAGNDSSDVGSFYPANLWDVITVAATDPYDNQAYFSNFGQKIDVAAPGVDILSLQASGTALGTVVTPGYMRLSGTSMAAPHVSGLAALILSQHPDYSNEDVRQAIRTSATPLGTAAAPGADNFDPDFGYGRIDCAQAMAVSSVLEAKISSPANGSAYAAAVTVTGVAQGAGLASWVLQYALSTNTSSWTTIASGTAPVSGTLGTFDAGKFANGTYIIRLTALNAAGNAFTDRTGVLVETAAITNPALGLGITSATTFKPGAVVPIVGTVAGEGFQSYKVEWSRQLRFEMNWLATGVTLAGQGQSPVNGATLAQWDTSSLTEAGYYFIRLTEVSTYFTNVVTTTVYLEPDLYSTEWPKFLNTTTGLGLLPAANADGSTRLLVPSSSGLWTLPLSGNPQQQNGCCATANGIAVANINGASGDEAIIGTTQEVDVVSQDGTFQIFTPSPVENMTSYPTGVADLNGDSQLEAFAVGVNPINQAVYLYGWHSDGTPLGGNFPLQASDRANQSTSAYMARFLTADIRGDGNNELVLPDDVTNNSWTLRLFAADGALQTWAAPVFSGAPEALAAADLDNNGQLEVIAVSVDVVNGQVTLHVLQPDGSERAGWPVQIPFYGTSNAALAVGDLNRDGQKEIVCSVEAEVNVFTSSGASLSAAWPLTTQYIGVFGPVLIADIDGDGYPEILTSSLALEPNPPPLIFDFQLIAIRHDGTIAKTWQLNGMNGYDLLGQPTPAIGDFDNSGLTEIAAQYWVVGQAPEVANRLAGVVTLLQTGAPYNSAVNDWPMAFHDARNSAVLSAGPSVCTYGVAPWPLTLDGAAASGSFNVQATSATCQWNATSDSSWLTLTSAFASGSSGSGTVSYSAAANHTSAARTAHVTIGSQTFLVTQPVDTLPQYTLTVLVEPAGAGTAGPGGSYESGTNVCLTEAAGKGWTFAAWSGAPPLTGSCFIITANTTVTANFTTSGCAYSLDANHAQFGPAGGKGKIGVTANNSACQWDVSSDAPWVTINSATTSTGNGIVQYTVATNTTRPERTAHLNVAGEDFTITQRIPMR